MGRTLFDFFVFSSIYIALCALLMVGQSNYLLNLEYTKWPYFGFVFFSTICSYNFHWYLTPDVPTERIRVRWTQQHKTLHFLLFFIGLAGSAAFFFFLTKYWLWLGGGAILTFLYSAPKIRFRPFNWLRKIAIGKTLFLAFVWMYVTTIIPVALSEHPWTLNDLLFCANRFFLVYSICIIFDYRDRLNDRQEGIRSMITYFDEKGVDRLFYLSMALFLLTTLALAYIGFTIFVCISLLIPGTLTLALYRTAKANMSDYLYYFVLDGLMMGSALITLFVHFLTDYH